jgi:hypothetical protein
MWYCHPLVEKAQPLARMFDVENRDQPLPRLGMPQDGSRTRATQWQDVGLVWVVADASAALTAC